MNSGPSVPPISVLGGSFLGSQMEFLSVWDCPLGRCREHGPFLIYENHGRKRRSTLQVRVRIQVWPRAQVTRQAPCDAHFLFLRTDLESGADAAWLLGNRCGRTASAIVDGETHLGASRRQRQGRHLGEVFPALHIQK